MKETHFNLQFNKTLTDKIPAMTKRTNVQHFLYYTFISPWICTLIPINLKIVTFYRRETKTFVDNVNVIHLNTHQFQLRGMKRWGEKDESKDVTAHAIYKIIGGVYSDHLLQLPNIMHYCAGEWWNHTNQWHQD